MATWLLRISGKMWVFVERSILIASCFPNTLEHGCQSWSCQVTYHDALWLFLPLRSWGGCGLCTTHPACVLPFWHPCLEGILWIRWIRTWLSGKPFIYLAMNLPEQIGKRNLQRSVCWAKKRELLLPYSQAMICIISGIVFSIANLPLGKKSMTTFFVVKNAFWVGLLWLGVDYNSLGALLVSFIWRGVGLYICCT